MTHVRTRMAAAVVGVGVALATVSAGVGHAAEDARARRLLARASTAAYDTEFTGEVVVQWRDETGQRRRRAEVASDDGVLHVGEDRLVGSEGRTVRRTDHGWELLGTHAGGKVPDPGRKYDLEVEPGALVAGRATRTVEVAAHGKVRERLFFDAATGVLLRRDQLDRSGRLDRRVAFATFTVTSPVVPGSARVPRVDPSSAASAPRPVTDVPDEMHAPTRVDDGYRLVTALDDDAAGLQLFYSDGVVGLSVFEAQGALEWDGLPAGGGWTRVGGRRTRVYTSAAGHVLVWEDDGVTYTCVSDAPVADIAAFVADFGDPHDPGWMERAGRFVTGPFRWE